MGFYREVHECVRDFYGAVGFYEVFLMSKDASGF